MFTLLTDGSLLVLTIILHTKPLLKINLPRFVEDQAISVFTWSKQTYLQELVLYLPNKLSALI